MLRSGAPSTDPRNQTRQSSNQEQLIVLSSSKPESIQRPRLARPESTWPKWASRPPELKRSLADVSRGTYSDIANTIRNAQNKAIHSCFFVSEGCGAGRFRCSVESGLVLRQWRGCRSGLGGSRSIVSAIGGAGQFRISANFTKMGKASLETWHRLLPRTEKRPIRAMWTLCRLLKDSWQAQYVTQSRGFRGWNRTKVLADISRKRKHEAILDGLDPNSSPKAPRQPKASHVNKSGSRRVLRSASGKVNSRRT